MAITGGLSSGGLTGSASPTVLIVLRELDDIGPAAMAVARACPTYSRKTSDSALQKVTVGFVTAAEPATLVTDATALSACALLAESVRAAAHIAETPAEDMSTADVEARARELLEGVPNVGKSAAPCPHSPVDSSEKTLLRRDHVHRGRGRQGGRSRRYLERRPGVDRSAAAGHPQVHAGGRGAGRSPAHRHRGQGDRKTHDHCWHLGYILPRVPSDDRADRCMTRAG